MTQKADSVIYGNIYTVDQTHPKAEAAAIADGKFAVRTSNANSSLAHPLLPDVVLG